MAELTFDIRYEESRNRVTNAFRLILAIPHLLIAAAWSYFAQLLAFIQWFIIIFTGKRNQAMWDLQWAYLGYAGRVNGYVDLMFDPYPPIGTDPGATGTVMNLRFEEPANRLTNGLRFIWAIPAIVIGFVISIAFSVVVLISWFAIVITGRHPRGMFDFSLQALRYTFQLNAYVMLMTDTYPKWGTGAGSPALTPGSPLPPPRFAPT